MSTANVAHHKNEVHLAGVLARDPEVRHTSSGKTVANLTVATKYKESTEYHRVTCWEQCAEKAGSLHKGDFVKVVGRLQTRSWEDKQSGQKKYATEVIAWQFVVPGKEPVTVSTTGKEITDEDVPFF
jgi:single-strand DNA-binding protein